MDLEWWLRLSNARNLSPRQCARLLNHFGNPRAVCAASAAELKSLGVKAEAMAELQQADSALLASQYRWAEQAHQSIITWEDKRYPPLLKTIPDPPPVLFVRGDAEVLAKPQLALVGSRNPSPGGLKTAREFAAELTQAGLIITSGLAMGIDGASHQGALEGGGVTIAVLGSGLERLYPARHRDLAENIVTRGGALVSEFPMQVPPLAANFPRRNRIISGMSWGTCVVEATQRSGSLITAKLAAEQGREVFAVPGSIYNPAARGCHVLIQEGAKLVSEVADILTEFKQGISQWYIIPSATPLTLKLDYDCRQLLECVGFEATTVDELVQRSNRSVAQVTELLLTLELNGFIQAAAGGYYRVL